MSSGGATPANKSFQASSGIGARLQLLHRAALHAHVRVGDGVVDALRHVEVTRPGSVRIELRRVGQHLIDGGHVLEPVGVTRGGAGARRVVAENAAVVVIHARQKSKPRMSVSLLRNGLSAGPRMSEMPFAVSKSASGAWV